MKAMLGIALLLSVCSLTARAMETRPVQDQERSSFDAFYRAHFPGARPAQPVFTVERDRPGQAWRVYAKVDVAPRRAPRGLCRMERMRFALGTEWTMEQPTRLAWISKAACAVPPAQHVLVLERMPDTDVSALLEQAPGALARARLLFAGNTSCAVQRSLKFSLHAIDVGSPVAGGEEMAELIFRSDRATSATIWVRRSGLSYDPWNVSCN